MKLENGVGVLLGLTLSALTGCGNSDQSEAEDNLALWRAKGPTSYVYIIETSCFCPDVEPIRVVVTDGAVTSAVGTRSGETRQAKTMTEVLQDVVHEAGQDNESFSASYDPTFGYLKHLEVDHTSASDDELSKTVSCLEPGTGDDVCPP